MRAATKEARRIHIGGIVQGVGFRPFVYRLANEHKVTGWVLNADAGVEIHAEGDPSALTSFIRALTHRPPPAARIAEFDDRYEDVAGFETFEIRHSERNALPSVPVSPDLPVCDACLRELFDPSDRRYKYPYINCTNCGPRFSIIRGLPYDRPQTTMQRWPMCPLCRYEYEDPANRRFHAQPIACPQCGPRYVLEAGGEVVTSKEAIERAAEMLHNGAVVGIKGIGGYHLACDARNALAVEALRTRKYRKERPFAVMVRDIETAAKIIALDDDTRALLSSTARPIVLAAAIAQLPGVAPDNADLGVMLAYTPVHHLLFAAGAPPALVMTSGNRSSEPIAYTDEDARAGLHGIADALLTGEREIARRIDDSVTRIDVFGPTIIRHARGYAPQAVASLPCAHSILATGADLKNAIAVVVRGQAFLGQHVGDVEHFPAFTAFKESIADLAELYELDLNEAVIAHDAHPEYASSRYARDLPGKRIAVQHHRAHIASVLAEYRAFDVPVIGFAFDGTGYGDDGTIWGGEIFGGSLASGLRRYAHMREALLPGGDAAARFPVQAAAGFLHELEVDHHRFSQPPFMFPDRYEAARELLRSGLRTFRTTSIGRLFDTVAALLGFTRPITFEAQAAMWLEHLARGSTAVRAYPFPFRNAELDYRPLLAAIIEDRVAGRSREEIARAFHEAIAASVVAVADEYNEERVVVSGGVFQNALLLGRLQDALRSRLMTNRVAPPNDGGIALGQAAIASLR